MSATANSLFESLPAAEVALLAAIFNQLGDTLETLAAAAALREQKGGVVSS